MFENEDDVHIWRIALDLAQDPSGLDGMLSADERHRAGRFRFERDRRRAIVRRAALRQILGQYVGTSPVELKFAYEPQGKPVLDGTWAAQGWHFNLSFSNERALCAIARQPLGIDIEWHRPVVHAALVAKHFFTPAEVRLQTEATADVDRIFLTHWTRKESLIKATGSGLSVPLNSFDVRAVSDVPHWQVTLADAAGRQSAWWLCDLAPSPQYIAALATAFRAERQRWFDWQPTGGWPY